MDEIRWRWIKPGDVTAGRAAGRKHGKQKTAKRRRPGGGRGTVGDVRRLAMRSKLQAWELAGLAE